MVIPTTPTWPHPLEPPKHFQSRDPSGFFSPGVGGWQVRFTEVQRSQDSFPRPRCSGRAEAPASLTALARPGSRVERQTLTCTLYARPEPSTVVA